MDDTNEEIDEEQKGATKDAVAGDDDDDAAVSTFADGMASKRGICGADEEGTEVGS